MEIIEINADTVELQYITLNGKKLKKGTDFTVSGPTTAGASWYRYTYSLNKSLFAEEGQYKVVVSSKDKAKNEAFSDVKNVSVDFVVDRTAPIVTVSGMTSDGRYQAEEQTVTITPMDDGGFLKSILVRTVDADGKELVRLIDLSGEDLEKALEAGPLTFTLKEGLYQNVQIICTDIAGNSTQDEHADAYYFSDVTVTPNAFMIFWANKPLRYGVIAGIIVLAAGAIYLFVIRPKKKKA